MKEINDPELLEARSRVRENREIILIGTDLNSNPRSFQVVV